MPMKAAVVVKGRDGLPLGTIEHPEFVDQSSGANISIDLEDGRTLQVACNLLVLQSDGSYTLDLSSDEFRKSVSEPASEPDSESIVVPLVEESVEVGKRRVESGKVRVHKTVKTAEKVIDEPVFREEVEVERVVLNRPIEEPVGSRQEGDTLVVPLLEEILVVEKRLILREEIRITRRRVEERSSQTVILRSETAEIERTDGST